MTNTSHEETSTPTVVSREIDAKQQQESRCGSVPRLGCGSPLSPTPVVDFPIGVIGLGRMAWALVEPLLSSKAFSADQVLAVVGRPLQSATVSRQLPSGVRSVF